MCLKGSGRVVWILASGLPCGRGGIVTKEVFEKHLPVPARYHGTGKEGNARWDGCL